MENQKSINDLPIELLRHILLRLPVRSLLLIRCVSKTWLHLISDPNFAKSHFELAAAPTRRCLFKQNLEALEALSYDLDALFHDGYAPVKFSLPCESPSTVFLLESCRGFVLLDVTPHMIIWNPSTGAHRRIPYPLDLSLSIVIRHPVLLFCGFWYDASTDDYLVALGWRDEDMEYHFDFFSMRNNSWKNFEVAFPTPLFRYVQRRGLFLNGAFHWLAAGFESSIIVFDPKERSVSEIPLPEHAVYLGNCGLMELEGCLATYFWNKECKLEIWVMKEYKVQSSWTSYGIFHMGFIPLSLSRGGDITGYNSMTSGFEKYNVSGQKLEHLNGQVNTCVGYTMYTESLLSLPNYSKDKKKGCQVSQECLEQLDVVTNSKHNEVKDQRKRIRRAPTWTRDFYCN